MSGEVWFEGKKLDIRTLKDSIDAGIALIPVETFEAGLRKAMEYAYIDANKGEK